MVAIKSELKYHLYVLKSGNINFIHSQNFKNKKKNTAALVSYTHTCCLVHNNNNLGIKETKIFAQDLANKNL